MDSLIVAVQALTHGYNLLTNRITATNKALANAQANRQPPIASKNQANKANQGRFVEQPLLRVTVLQKVYSKQDPTVWVEFLQINTMTFKDSVTGELWTWNR